MAVSSPNQRDLNREAFLWYSLTSPEYMDRGYAKLTEAADIFRSEILRYEDVERYEPVPRWLAAMERLEENYANARVMLVEGNYDGMGDWAGSLENIPRGIGESIMTWMEDDALEHFEKTLDQAYRIASAFTRAILMSSRHFKNQDEDWRMRHDAAFPGWQIALRWDDFESEVINIPEYAADKSSSCNTGDIVRWTGVWIPENGDGSTALAFARLGQIMQSAFEVVARDEDGFASKTRPIDVTWHPFRPTGRMIPVHGEVLSDPNRVPAGGPCPQSGWWHTPAKANSRRHFNHDEFFPTIDGSDYGATFWLWSKDQSGPSLG